MSISPHQRFAKQITLNEEEISGFATAIGDTNPLHHDTEFAQEQGYPAVSASGAQSTSLLMGCVADYFSQLGPMVGLEFSMFFRQPVFATERLAAEWLIVSTTPKPRINAQLIELRGRITSRERGTSVGAKGKVLLYAN